MVHIFFITWLVMPEYKKKCIFVSHMNFDWHQTEDKKKKVAISKFQPHIQ